MAGREDVLEVLAKIGALKVPIDSVRLEKKLCGDEIQPLMVAAELETAKDGDLVRVDNDAL